MGGKKKVTRTTKFKEFNDENLEIINAKKLQEVEKQGSCSPKNSPSNLERKSKESQTKKGQENSGSSKSAPEKRNKAEVKLPESSLEVEVKIQINKKTSLSKGQTHHNVDKENANQQVLVKNDDKAYNVHAKVSAKVLDSNFTSSAENLQEALTIIPKKEKKTVALEYTKTQVNSPNTNSTNMEHPVNDVQGSKPKPDNPAWINSATGPVPFPGHPFSALNPNASEFTPGGCFGIINPPKLPDVHPTLPREIMSLNNHPVVPPGILEQPNRVSTRTSAQVPVQPFPSHKNIPLPLQEEPLHFSVESTTSVEEPTSNCNIPFPDLKNSTSAWNVDRIKPHHYPTQQKIEKPLQSSQDLPSTTYVQQSLQEPTQLPQPSSHNTFTEPVYNIPKVEPTNSYNNWSAREYTEQNHNRPDQRQGNQRDSFYRNNDRSRGFQDRRGGRARGRRFNEDKEETRGGRVSERPFNDERTFSRRNEKFIPLEPEQLIKNRDQNAMERQNKNDRRGGMRRPYNKGREFEGRRGSSEIEKRNQFHSNDDWDEAPKEIRTNSKETGKDHDRVEKNNDFYKNDEWRDKVRNLQDFKSTRGRGRRQNDNSRGNNTRQIRSNENRGYESRSDLNPFQRDQNRDSLDNKLNSSQKDEDTRQKMGDYVETTVEAPGDKEIRLLETANKSETSWRDHTNDSNRYFTRHRDTNNPRYNNKRGAFGNSRGRGDVQFPRENNSRMRGGRENGRGKHNSPRINQNKVTVRRNSTEAIEITNDDSSKDSSDNYHITDDDSNDVPEKIVELEVKSSENVWGKSDISHDSETWHDWNDSVDNAVETALESIERNALLPSEVETKETRSSVEHVLEDEEALDMSKRRLEISDNNMSRNSSYRTSERRGGEPHRRSLELKNLTDPRMEREKLNRSADSAHWGSDESAISSGTKLSGPSFKQTRLTSYLTEKDGEKEHPDKEFDRWETAWHKIKDFHVVQEIQGDLFEQPKDFSLAHCVAEDLRMGSGIAVDFKREFKNVDDLLEQRAKQGGLATLHDESTNRFVYYLVTKRESTGKPTYLTLWKSLTRMRAHIKENEVKKLAIPRLACGLDRLEWNKVKSMIEHVFEDVDVEIRVCNFQQNYGQTKKKPQTKASNNDGQNKKSKNSNKK